jgi:hypothetical protein
MKILYDVLFRGEIPFDMFAKSKHVRVWFEKDFKNKYVHKWIRQEDPHPYPSKIDQFKPIQGKIHFYNVLLPMQEVKINDLKEYIKDKLSLLRVNKNLGHLVIIYSPPIKNIKDYDDYLTFAMYHDTRDLLPFYSGLIPVQKYLDRANVKKIHPKLFNEV